jgi:hypothetical protein
MLIQALYHCKESQSSAEVLYVASSVTAVKQFKNKDVLHAMKKRCAHFLTIITTPFALSLRKVRLMSVRPCSSPLLTKEEIWA